MRIRAEATHQMVPHLCHGSSLTEVVPKCYTAFFIIRKVQHRSELYRM